MIFIIVDNKKKKKTFSKYGLQRVVLSFHMYYLLLTRCLVYDKQLAFSPAVAHWGLGSVSEIGPSTRCPAAWEGAVAQDKYNSQSPADSQIKREATQTTRIMANSSFKLKFNIMAHVGLFAYID